MFNHGFIHLVFNLLLDFTHVISCHVFQPKQKRTQFPEDLSGTPNMAVVSLLWDTSMAAVTSCENQENRIDQKRDNISALDL